MFDQAHVFVDESGSLHTLESRPVMVGGIVVLGKYSAEDDLALNRTLKVLVRKFGGTTLRDLHDRGSPTFLGFDSLDQLRAELGSGLADWTGRDRLVRGMTLVHQADVFDEGPWILAEGVLDNRYIHMVWSLLEHLLFVDPWIQSHLDPGAKIHLHVANRKVFYPNTSLNREYLERMGHGYTLGGAERGGNWLEVSSSINERDLRSSFRMALREKWPKRGYELATAEVRSIAYADSRRQTKACLYIADLQLMAVRGSILGHPSSYPASELFRLGYDHILVKIALFKSRIEQGLHEGSAEIALEISEAIADNPDLASCLGGLRADLRRVLEERQGRFEEMLERASRLVDEPGHATKGRHLGQTAWGLLSVSRRNQPGNRARWIQVRLSHANHTGNRATAESLWQEFTAMEASTAGMGMEGVSMRARLWNRRAVSLMDRFRLDEAEAAIMRVIPTLQSVRDTIAKECGIEPPGFPFPELGSAYGTLGQIQAIHGLARHKEAEAFFRRAYTCFPKGTDSERQLVYLGHLACDQGEAGREIWQDVVAGLPMAGSAKPALFKGSQFILALQAKGLSIFGQPKDLESFVLVAESSNLENVFGPEVMASHPFGLLWQDLALCSQKLWQIAPEKNSRFFELAVLWFEKSASVSGSMSQPLFTLMKRLALFRKGLLLASRHPDDPEASETIRAALPAILRSAARVGITDTGIHPDGPAKASETTRAILGLLPFYFW